MGDRVGSTDTGSGSGTINGNAGTSVCGRYRQLIEAGATNNVAQIR